jgi:hypothetical protein
MHSNRWPEIQATQGRVSGERLDRAWGEFLGRVPWQLFVTLTFNPRRWPSVDQRLAAKEGIWWCQQAARLVRQPVAWLVATERHRDGRWHVHVLLAGLPDGLGCAPESMWKQRCGGIDVRAVHAGSGAVVYATKTAAMTGDVELSDTLTRYRSRLDVSLRVALYPAMRGDTESGVAA